MSFTNFYAAQLWSKVAYHDFGGITVHLDEVQVVSQALGALRAIPVPVLEGCVRDSLNFNPQFGAGEDAFAALQRLIDKVDPSYRA